MRAGGKHQPWVIVVPSEELQRKLVAQAHAAGRSHANAAAMERELRRRYWWWGLREMCVDKVNECVSCQRNKVRTRLSFDLLHQLLRHCRRPRVLLCGPSRAATATSGRLWLSSSQAWL